MSTRGIIRRIDDLGRIVIPREIRKQIQVMEGDPMEIILDDGDIIIRKVDEALPAKQLLKRTVDLMRDDWSIDCEVRKSVIEKLNDALAIVNKGRDAL